MKNIIDFCTSDFLRQLCDFRNYIAVLWTSVLIAASASISFSQTYTMDDRDRLIRVEEQIKSLEKQINSLNDKMEVKFKAIEDKFEARFDAINTRFEAIDDKINRLYTLIYFVLGGVFGLIGLIFWDRKTALAPVARDTRNIKEILYQLAKTNPELKDIINKAAL